MVEDCLRIVFGDMGQVSVKNLKVTIRKPENKMKKMKTNTEKQILQ